MNAHRFCELHFNGDVRVNNRYVGTPWFVPGRVPHSHKVHVNEHNIDNFFGVTEDGECVNIYASFDCGHCIECAKKKQSDIRNRMRLEQMCYDCPPIFLTLTYNDKFLPEDGVNRDHIAKFFNRLHLNLFRSGHNQFFRHICFSEYGSKHGRPHYHAIIFGLDYTQFRNLKELDNIFLKSWSHNPLRRKDTSESLGFIYWKLVDGRAFDYVSKYVGKDYILNLDDSFESSYQSFKTRNIFKFTSKDGVEHIQNPNFVSSSRRNGGAIGCKWLEDLKPFICTAHFPRVTLRDKQGIDYSFVLPKFIRDKVFPSLSNMLPYDVKNSLRDLGIFTYALSELFRKGLSLDCYDQQFCSIPKFVHERYSLWSHMFNFMLFNPNDQRIVDVVARHDPSSILYNIKKCLRVLSSYFVPYEEFLEIVASRNRFMNIFCKEAQFYLSVTNSYSPNSRFNKYLNDFNNIYRQRDLHPS